MIIIIIVMKIIVNVRTDGFDGIIVYCEDVYIYI